MAYYLAKLITSYKQIPATEIDDIFQGTSREIFSANKHLFEKEQDKFYEIVYQKTAKKLEERIKAIPDSR